MHVKNVNDSLNIRSGY